MNENRQKANSHQQRGQQSTERFRESLPPRGGLGHVVRRRSSRRTQPQL
jgi:hypothetical protein